MTSLVHELASRSKSQAGPTSQTGPVIDIYFAAERLQNRDSLASSWPSGGRPGGRVIPTRTTVLRLVTWTSKYLRARVSVTVRRNESRKQPCHRDGDSGSRQVCPAHEPSVPGQLKLSDCHHWQFARKRRLPGRQLGSIK